MKGKPVDFDLLDNLIRESQPQSVICRTMAIGKKRLNEELILHRGRGYKEHVATVLGQYLPPSTLSRRVTKEHLENAFIKHNTFDLIAQELGLKSRTALLKLVKTYGYKSYVECRAILRQEQIPIDYKTKVDEILQLVRGGKNFKDACILLGVSYNAFISWHKQSSGGVSLVKLARELQGKPYFSVGQRQEYRKEWMKNNVHQRLAKRVSTSILKCLGKTKLSKTSQILEKDLGYTIEDLKVHLEKQFDEKMNWDNYGTYWHIDHRKPVSWFNFKSSSCPSFIECWSLENLRPFEAIANIKKGNRWAA